MKVLPPNRGLPGIPRRSPSRRSKAPAYRKYARSRDDRQVYVALTERSDSKGHVISPGELFTFVARAGVCQECKPFTFEGWA